MRIGLFAVVALVAALAFYVLAPGQRAAAPIAPAAQIAPAPRKDTPATFANEWVTQSNREQARKSVQKAFDVPWSKLCTPEGKKLLINALDGYYWTRSGQRTFYVNTWGEEGRRYFENAWRTSDDYRITGLVRDQYLRGYINLNDLKPYIRTAMAEVLGDLKPQAKPCEG